MPTEREAVARERAAFVNGARVAGSRPVMEVGEYRSWQEAAEHYYPAPRLTRPRVVRDPHANGLHWRFRKEKLEWCDGLDEDLWWNEPRAAVTPARVALWADLLARPTEEVEEEGP